MTNKEIAMIFDQLKFIYPSYLGRLSETEMAGLTDAWAVFFTDDDPATFLTALKTCALTCKFFPSIAEVREQIVTLTQPEQPTEQEAWGLVRKVLSYGYSDTNRAWDDLPPEIQRAVGSKTVLRDWALTDTDQVNTVIASNFMRSYRVIAAREEKYRALPSPIRDQIKALALSKSVAALGGGQS